MWVVIDEFEVFVAEVFDGPHGGVELHLWERHAVSRELLFRLVEVVCVEVKIAKSVDEVLGLLVANLRDHHGEECVGCDVEGHAEEDVCAALVELAAQFAVRDVELEEGVAGGRAMPLVRLGSKRRRCVDGCRDCF